MPLNRNTLFTVENPSPDYRDYRYLQDDARILENPHKGWYYHYIDNGYKRKLYRDQFAPDAKKPDFPCMNHLYLRFDWADIEAEKGVYDWSYLDAIMDKWGKEGYTFSLRLCTYEYGFTAVPDWLIAGGIGGMMVEHPDRTDGRLIRSFEPDYGDPTFLKELDILMQAYGRKYNGDKRIEFIDVGTFGTWGEGHTSGGSGRRFPLAILKEHIDLHIRYFPDTVILVNDDIIQCPTESPEDSSALYDYCVSRKLGIRDDSMYVGSFTRPTRYKSLRNPSFFAGFYDHGPIDIEKAHESYMTEENFRDGFPFLETLRYTRATYAGFHGHMEPWLAKAKYFTKYCANRLGYWYFIEGLDLPDKVLPETRKAELYIQNRGFAHGYYRYDLKISLLDGDGKLYPLSAGEPDSRSWEPDIVTKETLHLDFSAVPPGEYTICIGLFEGERPIRLGFAAELEREDGFYSLDTVTVLPR